MTPEELLTRLWDSEDNFFSPSRLAHCSSERDCVDGEVEDCNTHYVKLRLSTSDRPDSRRSAGTQNDGDAGKQWARRGSLLLVCIDAGGR